MISPNQERLSGLSSISVLRSLKSKRHNQDPRGSDHHLSLMSPYPLSLVLKYHCLDCAPQRLPFLKPHHPWPTSLAFRKQPLQLFSKMLVIPSLRDLWWKEYPSGGKKWEGSHVINSLHNYHFSRHIWRFSVAQFPISQPQEEENCFHLPRLHIEFAYPVWEGPPYC